MLDHAFTEIPLIEHPFFNRIKSAIEKFSSNKNLIGILEDHANFIYPKTISFSFGEDYFSNKYIKDYSNNVDEHIILNDGEHNHKLSISRLCFIDFYSNFLSILHNIKLNPIIIFDFSNSLIFDQLLLDDLSRVMRDRELKLKLIAIGKNSLRKYIDPCNDVLVFFSKDAAFSHIDEYIREESNLLKITFKGVITLQSMEETFLNINLSKEVMSKYLVVFDLTYASKISTFPLFLFSLIIHSIAHEYGILSNIYLKGANPRIISKLTLFRIFKINKYFLLDSKALISWDHDPKNFGIYLFNDTVFERTIDNFDQYLANVARIAKGYLESYISKKYYFPGTTKKEATYRLTIQNIISSIVSELIENAILHSGGVGYIAGRVISECLYLFIADCGVGLNKGILKNYEMSDDIIDDRSAIHYAFQLHEHHAKRKKVGVKEYNYGRGLRDTLSNIFLCKGKLIFRTGNVIGSFVNPVSKGYVPTRIIDSNLNISGTQYMIIIPLTERAENNLPNKTDMFLNLED